jgi:hypothetical protein
MILSPGRSYVFIHIPKTGGTALALALEARAKADDIMVGDTPKARKRRRRVRDVQTHGRLWKHSSLADIAGLVPDETLSGLFAFTLVRNPWDRVVSYYHWLQDQRFDHPAVTLAQELDFEAFLERPEVTQAFRAWPARAYMTRADGQEQCSAWIRLEHFEEDSAPLCAHLGFSPDLPQANASARDRDYRAYHTTRTRQIVADCCGEDIARFGYAF